MWSTFRPTLLNLATVAMLKFSFGLALTTALLMAGCGPTIIGYRNNNYAYGGTQQEFDRDKYQCDLENTYQSGIAGMLSTGINQEMSARCMRVRGWHEVYQ